MISRLRFEHLNHIQTDAFNRRNRTTGTSGITPDRISADLPKPTRLSRSGHSASRAFFRFRAGLEFVLNSDFAAQAVPLGWYAISTHNLEAEVLDFFARLSVGGEVWIAAK
jgi:hypothetical protein